MREIKFRAWDTQNHKFKTLDALYFDNDGKINAIALDTSVFCKEMVELMQYTGLKDKNGTEIYEGDIVEISDKDDLRYLERYANLDCMRKTIIKEKKLIKIYKYVFSVVFTREFKLENNKDYLSLYDYSKLCKIIGNVYETPELLEEQK